MTVWILSSRDMGRDTTYGAFEDPEDGMAFADLVNSHWEHTWADGGCSNYFRMSPSNGTFYLDEYHVQPSSKLLGE